jgi:cysteine desulfurase family protein (TIGR01976 family)
MLDIQAIRAQFPGLGRQVDGKPAIFFDGPAGTQVPICVADAVRDALLHTNANHGGVFATSRESDAMLDRARVVLRDFLGAHEERAVVFGANMTTMTFQFSRALARTWQPGDEIILSDSDHDANVTPWVLAAHEAGVKVHRMRLRPEDCTLDLDDYRCKLSSRTKLVAVGVASNATGTIHPVREITRLAHEVGAVVYLDAVHFGPHGLIDVSDWGCDGLICSAYKFFGPHVGILWARPDLLERWPAYKVRPAADTIPDRWMTGTQNHEGIAGTMAAVEYLMGLSAAAGGPMDGRSAVVRTMTTIADIERELSRHFLDGMAAKRGWKVWGMTDAARLSERVPTFSITHESQSPESIARRLASEGIFVWHGNYYALPLTESLGVEPAGMVRVGMVHYNTHEEIERFLAVL